MSKDNSSILMPTTTMLNTAKSIITVNKSLTAVGNNSVAKVTINPKEKCNPVVNMALPKVYGTCSYYYVPYNGDPIKKGTKLDYMDKNGVNIRYLLTHAPLLDVVKKSQSNWDFASEVIYKIIKNRDALLALDEGNPNWSRYADFMKRHTSTCGHLPPAYYRAYGYYYCSRFGTYLLPSMDSKEGKRWLKSARRYLQEYMDNGLGQNNKGTEIYLPSKLNEKASQKMSFAKQTVELSDKTFKTFAFKSHVPAYIDGGIEDIPFDDLLKIICEPNIQEWMDIETFQQAIQVAEIVYPKISTIVRVVLPKVDTTVLIIEKWDDIKKIWQRVTN